MTARNQPTSPQAEKAVLRKAHAEERKHAEHERKRPADKLDDALMDSFPSSDPAAATNPNAGITAHEAPRRAKPDQQH